MKKQIPIIDIGVDVEIVEIPIKKPVKNKHIKRMDYAVSNLAPIVSFLIGIAIVLFIGFFILGDVAEEVNSNNMTDIHVGPISNIASLIPIIVITFIGSLLLGLVTGSMKDTGGDKNVSSSSSSSSSSRYK